MFHKRFTFWLIGMAMVMLPVLLASAASAVASSAAPTDFSCTDVTEIPQAECEALVDLYNSTSGPGWIDHSGWLVSTTPCSWHGLTCASGNVTHLQIDGNNLLGTLPSTLGDLAGLGDLNLSSNQLSGNIPPELGNLAGLWNLNLSSNQLSGSVPPELANLAGLGWLNLSSNQLSGSIPSQLGDLYLSQLNLSSNQLSGGIPPELGNLACPAVLNLSSNQLSGSIPPELGNLACLAQLYLSSNQLSGSIPPELGNLAGLGMLYLSSNQLSGSIPRELGDLAQLEALDLSSNQLSGSIPPELGSLVYLYWLNLGVNQLTGNIPPEIGNLSNLYFLILPANQLSGSIPAELGNLTKLAFFTLWGNQLSGSIPSELGNLANLGVLDFCGNQLSGTIPSSFGNLSQLSNLTLCSNQLDGDVPPELGNLGNLQFLNLHSNQLSGSIPSELGNTTNLLMLNLTSNGLSGRVPSEIGDLANLVELTVDHNPLSGPLPATMTNLTALSRFWFQNTGLCELSTTEFQTWLAGIADLGRTGVLCTNQPTLPVVQISTATQQDDQPALVENADGTLVSVWHRAGELWTAASHDAGATWSTASRLGDCCRERPALYRTSDDELWLVFNRGSDLWYRTSADGGSNWSDESQLTNRPERDYAADLTETADGVVWVVWEGEGASGIWYKTSSDGGVTWSSDTPLPVDSGWNTHPTIAQAPNGMIFVVWFRGYGLAYTSSSDGGANWSPLDFLDAGGPIIDPRLRRATDGKFWLAYQITRWEAGNWRTDQYYKTSEDSGATWSTPQRFTHFQGQDDGPALAALNEGGMGVAWQSDRSGNWDIWYGVYGQRGDINPPPYVSQIEHQPGPNPSSGDIITFRAWAQDEIGVAAVDLKWTLDGTQQPDLQMHDDGAHGDQDAGDGVYGIQHGSLPTGSQVVYQALATDVDGNTFLSVQKSFDVIEPFVKTADLLFVPDREGNDTSGFRDYFVNALDALGYSYDLWDTGRRGEPTSAVLNQYVDGVVIWAVWEWGYATNRDRPSVANLQGYLDAGGQLFITGQNIADGLRDTTLLRDYLHATFKQTDTGLYSLAGTAGDPIGDGLALNISGGDGANNQWSKDEVDPISPAEAVLTYQDGASRALVAPVRPVALQPLATPQPGEAGSAHRQYLSVPTAGPSGPAQYPTPTPSPGESGPAGLQSMPTPQPGQRGAAVAESRGPQAEPAGNISSGTAGLRVEADGYKVVYFAFGFEGINSAANRALTMERVLAWLNGVLPRPSQIAPADGQALGVGAVTFQWASVVGATGYEIQIDRVATFDSGDLIQETVSGVSTSHSFATVGQRYWRVRALPGSAWTGAWRFAIAGDIVQVTTDSAHDTYPAIARDTNGALWAVWGRNGLIWHKTSSDDGATWSADLQIPTDAGSNYDPAIAQGADGKLWVVWFSYRSGTGSPDIWGKYTTDGGVNWSSDMQLTIDPNGDYYPAIAQGDGGKLWVVWTYEHSGNADIWGKYTTDGGVNWSGEVQLTTDTRYDSSPAIAQAADGRLWVVWHRNDGRIWAKISDNGGATWSGDTVISPDCCYSWPALVAASDGVLWLASYRDGDIWYQTSGDNGATWSPPARFSRFVGHDEAPAVAALSAGRVGIAWQSMRSGNWDIWFGIPSEREDLNPPPYVQGPSHAPAPNPTSDEMITFTAWARDESGLASVELLWSLDGVAQPASAMFDDGAHGDGSAGDNVFGVQQAPLPTGSQVTYQVRATDVDGNTYTSYGRSFQVIAAFVKTADLLFVPDYGSNDTSWFRPYYTNALDALGYAYDVWDTGLRGAPPGAVLNQYTSGAIIWAVPYWGYATNQGSASVANLQAYLDNGGKLFLSGQSIAESLNGSVLLADYLHATYVQADTGLYGLTGTASDPIGDGLALNISGGDGANNQYTKDEIDPLAPAETVLTYQAGASRALAEPVQPAEGQPALEPPAGESSLAELSSMPMPPAGQRSGQATATTNPQAEPAGNISSGTAGLRVDTAGYKVVYFAFGFEGINSAVDRSVVMDRVLAWLGVTPSIVQATVSLSPGWNLVSLELSPLTPYTAQGWLDEINAQGGACSEVNRWLNGGWDAHIGGLPFNDFAVEPGQGYFLKCTATSQWTIEGFAFDTAVPLALQPGWNLVGVPYPPAGYTAQSLLDAIAAQGGACSEVNRWLNGGWDAHIGGLPFNDFTIEPNQGYFLKCSQASTFTP